MVVVEVHGLSSMLGALLPNYRVKNKTPEIRR